MDKHAQSSENISGDIQQVADPVSGAKAPYAIFVGIGAFLVVLIMGLIFLNSKKSLQETKIPISVPTQQPAQVDVLPTVGESTASAESDEVQNLEKDAGSIDTSELDDPLQEIDKEIRAL